MGEIGTPRRDYLYDLRYWELLLISRGYQHRHRDAWSMTRWQTYNIMLAQCGSKSLREAGINTPADLLQFPWDKTPAAPITDEEAADLLAEMHAINAANSATPLSSECPAVLPPESP